MFILDSDFFHPVSRITDSTRTKIWFCDPAVLRIWVVYLGSDFYLSWIDQQQQKRRKFFCSCLTFLVTTSFTKLKIILLLKNTEKILADLQKLWYFLPKKLSLSSQKYGLGIRDPVSGKKPILDPRSRCQKSTVSWILISNIAFTRLLRP
jgi:hypothetical protein